MGNQYSTPTCPNASFYFPQASGQALVSNTVSDFFIIGPLIIIIIYFQTTPAILSNLKNLMIYKSLQKIDANQRKLKFNIMQSCPKLTPSYVVLIIYLNVLTFQ